MLKLYFAYSRILSNAALPSSSIISVYAISLLGVDSSLFISATNRSVVISFLGKVASDVASLFTILNEGFGPSAGAALIGLFHRSAASLCSTSS